MVLGIGAPAPNQSSPLEAWCKHTGCRAHPRQVFCAPHFYQHILKIENGIMYLRIKAGAAQVLRFCSVPSTRCPPEPQTGAPRSPQTPAAPSVHTARVCTLTSSLDSGSLKVTTQRVNRGPNPGHQLATPGQQEGAGLTAPTCLCFHSCQVGMFGLCSPAPDSRGSRDPLNLACTPPVSHLKTTKSGKSTDLEPPVTSLPSGPQRLLLRAMPGPNFAPEHSLRPITLFKKPFPFVSNTRGKREDSDQRGKWLPRRTRSRTSPTLPCRVLCAERLLPGRAGQAAHQVLQASAALPPAAQGAPVPRRRQGRGARGLRAVPRR